MERCIFCQIVAGESPSYKIYKDELFYAFLDIFPVTKGHILLVPKKHYRWVHDVPEFGQYWETARKLKQALDRAFKPQWVQYFTHGLVPHAHIHILPRYDEVGRGFLPEGKIPQPPKEEMSQLAAKIRTNL